MVVVGPRSTGLDSQPPPAAGERPGIRGPGPREAAVLVTHFATFCNQQYPLPPNGPLLSKIIPSRDGRKYDRGTWTRLQVHKQLSWSTERDQDGIMGFMRESRILGVPGRAYHGHMLGLAAVKLACVV